MKGVKIVKLKEHELPDPNKVVGIVICGGGGDYNPLNDIPELASDRIDAWFVAGDREEIEALLGKEVAPISAVADTDAVRRISIIYADSLAQAHANRLIGCTMRIVFLTGERAYVRGFKAGYGDVIEPCMCSGAIWREFRKIGALEETEPDANAPSYVPPHPEAGNATTVRLSARVGPIATLGPYEMPSEEVRGILIYGESNIGAEQGLEDRNLCLAVGDAGDWDRLVRAPVKARLAVPDPNAAKRICGLYSEALAPFAVEAAKSKKPPYRSMYGTAWTIVFLTGKAAYIRGFGARPEQGRIYDEWVEYSHELYQEFVKIGYLNEQLPRRDSRPK